MIDTSFSPAYVLWFGPTGLTIARALAGQGVPVVAMHSDPNDACMATRYARTVVLPPLSQQPEAWLSFLLEEGRRHAPLPCALFAASDEHWLFVARHRERLAPYFRFPLPTRGNLEEWPTKSFQYEAARELGISFPKTVRPRDAVELAEIASSARYPCLMKPDLSHEWTRAFGEKLSFMTSAARMLHRGTEALARNSSFVVQEYIPAPDHEVYGLYSYLDKSSEPLGYGVSRKIRQHEPYFGSSCLSRSVIEPRVVELGLKLLQGMGFHGLSSVEFKRDPRDGGFKLMEINVRSPLMMNVVVRSGVNLPYLAYCDVLGLPIARRHAAFRPGKRVGLLMNDLHSAAFYRDRGELTRLQWLRSWIGTRDLHFAWNDPRPFIQYAKTIHKQWRGGRFHRRYDPQSACMACSAALAEQSQPALDVSQAAVSTFGV